MHIATFAEFFGFQLFFVSFPPLYNIPPGLLRATIEPLIVSTMRRPTRSEGLAKERLRWTQELHDRFEEAVNQLGGPDSKF